MHNVVYFCSIILLRCGKQCVRQLVSLVYLVGISVCIQRGVHCYSLVGPIEE